MSPFDLVASLLLIAAAARFVNYRFLHMPQSIGLLVIALGLSGCILLFDHLTGSGLGVKTWVSGMLAFADLPYVLFNGALGFLLFAGALHVKLEELRSHAWTVLALATIGVLLATILYGAGAWEMFRLGGANVPFTWCIVLGAILAPTDPIAITGLLQEMGLPKGLLAVITGESLFNDGVAVVVFVVALGVAVGGDKITPAGIVTDFVREGLGGAALGLITGYIAYLAMRAVDEYQLEILISLALVTVTYAAADRAGASGPIATVVAGLFIGNRATRYAMSETTRTNLTLFWSVIDEILNTLLFLLIGLELVTIGTEHFWPAMMGGGVLLAVLTRFVSASVPAVSLNLHRLHHFRNLTVLTWGGLRGGISVALALGLPASPFRGLLLQIVYVVAVFTIVVQGLTMPPLVRLLFRERRATARRRSGQRGREAGRKTG